MNAYPLTPSDRPATAAALNGWHDARYEDAMTPSDVDTCYALLSDARAMRAQLEALAQRVAALERRRPPARVA